MEAINIGDVIVFLMTFQILFFLVATYLCYKIVRIPFSRVIAPTLLGVAFLIRSIHLSWNFFILDRLPSFPGIDSLLVSLSVGAFVSLLVAIGSLFFLKAIQEDYHILEDLLPPSNG